jgi:membrane-associated phospholipid phosphatase
MGLLIAFVGFSRLYLSRHHLSDVAVGMACGALAGLFVHYLYCRESS